MITNDFTFTLSFHFYYIPYLHIHDDITVTVRFYLICQFLYIFHHCILSLHIRSYYPFLLLELTIPRARIFFGASPGVYFSDSSPHCTQCIQSFIPHAHIHLSANAPRLSLTPVSSSCCTGLRHHAARHHTIHTLRHRASRHRSPSSHEPPRPHRRTATRGAPQRTNPSLIPSLSRPRSSVQHHNPRPHHRFRGIVAPRPIDRAPNQRAPAPTSQCPSQRAPQRAIALQAALTSATLTTTTTLASTTHMSAPRTPAPRATRTTLSRARLITMA